MPTLGQSFTAASRSEHDVTNELTTSCALRWREATLHPQKAKHRNTSQTGLNRVWPSATLSWQKPRICVQLPQLPRKVPRRPGRLTVTKCATRRSRLLSVHACCAKRRSMLPKSKVATQMQRGCEQVLCLARKGHDTERPWHAGHAKRRLM